MMFRNAELRRRTARIRSRKTAARDDNLERARVMELIIVALDAYPEARMAVVRALEAAGVVESHGPVG